MARISRANLRREVASILETWHLLRSPANAERLLRSIEDAEAGKLTEHELIDPPEDNE